MGMKDDDKDQVVLGPELGNGQYACLRKRGDKVTTGVITPVDSPEGEDLSSRAEGLIELEHVDGDLYDVSASYDYTSLGYSERSGPAQVNTPKYQKGWDTIFGKKVVGQA